MVREGTAGRARLPPSRFSSPARREPRPPIRTTTRQELSLMKAWLLKQLNLTGEFADHLDEVALTFQSPRLLVAGYRATGSAADADTRRALHRMSRAKLAQAVVGGSAQPLFQRLAKKYDVQYFSFAAEMARIGVDPAQPKLPEPPTLGGPRTQIG